MTWKALDDQMAKWQEKLVGEVKVSQDVVSKLATTVASEIRFLDAPAKQELTEASPVRLLARLEELQAFQGWMDLALKHPENPLVVRAQVICQNYVCFVYLPESCFRVLSKKSPAGSTTRKCARFSTDNPVMGVSKCLGTRQLVLPTGLLSH